MEEGGRHVPAAKARGRCGVTCPVLKIKIFCVIPMHRTLYITLVEERLMYLRYSVRFPSP